MRQDSETNMIVLNTALKYKIQRNIQKKHKYTKYKHILKTASAKAREINRRTFERLYRGKLVISHGKLFQTLITRSEKNTERVALLQRRLNNL